MGRGVKKTPEGRGIVKVDGSVPEDHGPRRGKNRKYEPTNTSGVFLLSTTFRLGRVPRHSLNP